MKFSLEHFVGSKNLGVGHSSEFGILWPYSAKMLAAASDLSSFDCLGQSKRWVKAVFRVRTVMSRCQLSCDEVLNKLRGERAEPMAAVKKDLKETWFLIVMASNRLAMASNLLEQKFRPRFPAPNR